MTEKLWIKKGDGSGRGGLFRFYKVTVNQSPEVRMTCLKYSTEKVYYP